MADQCPLCGAINDYVIETFFSVECTNSHCTNYSEKTMERWYEDLRLAVQEQKQEIYGTTEKDVDGDEESSQESFDFYGSFPQGTD